MELSTPVGPDRSDPTTPLTAGEAMNRGAYAYWSVVEGGPLRGMVDAQTRILAEQTKVLADLKARIAKLEAAAAPKA